VVNLVICCDGTWKAAKSKDGSEPGDTNVWRLHHQLVADPTRSPESQHYYQEGIGTKGGFFKRILDGAIGYGLPEEIKRAYRWVCENYQPGDEIYLFGFSRGAYLVRSLSGLITCCGVFDLSSNKVHNADALLNDVIKEFERAAGGSFNRSKFKHRATSHGNASIRFIGVWDTVGSLGIPDSFSVQNLIDKHYFSDTRFIKTIQTGRQALAIDERRKNFTPTLWTDCDDLDVEQVWFSGVHTDVGGGYDDRSLGDITLEWMMNEAAKAGLRLKPVTFDSDPAGKLHQSIRGPFKQLAIRPRCVPKITEGAKQENLHASALQRQSVRSDYWPTLELDVGQSTEVEVNAAIRWGETGIYLHSDKTYQFEAVGEWADPFFSTDSDGDDEDPFDAEKSGKTLSAFSKYLKRKLIGNPIMEKVLPRREGGMPRFALVGAVANGTGANKMGNPIEHETFLIGDGVDENGSPISITPRKSGYLYCFANDAWYFYNSNRGSVRLKVTCVSGTMADPEEPKSVLTNEPLIDEMV